MRYCKFSWVFDQNTSTYTSWRRCFGTNAGDGSLSIIAMQWSYKEQRIYVIGSASHALLLKRYHCCVAGKHYESVGANARWQDGRPSSSANYQHCDKIFKGQRVASTTSSSTAVRSSNFTFSSSTDEQVKTLIEGKSIILVVSIYSYVRTRLCLYLLSYTF